MFCDGMGNDDMVRRIFMPLRLIDIHTSISKHVFFLQR